MSKSVRRVTAVLQDAGLDIAPVEIGEATTARMAADLLGCDVGQIAKSVMLRGLTSGEAVLFVTSGACRVDDARAAGVAGEALGNADAALIRAQTGFAIGGVAPFGHLTRPRAFFDPHLLGFAKVWAAAGTPRHLFGMEPQGLLTLCGAELAEFTA